MSDSVNGVKPSLPAYPVTQVKPAKKDRESGERKQAPRKPETNPDSDDDQRKPTIDEYI